MILGGALIVALTMMGGHDHDHGAGGHDDHDDHGDDHDDDHDDDH